MPLRANLRVKCYSKGLWPNINFLDVLGIRAGWIEHNIEVMSYMYKMVTLDNVQHSYEKMALEGLVEG